ncbi:MAG: hypothetical protein ICV83_21800 [Cytophagales bacterium]|nr:hypothetical protein [Cytophagales bacterium]
MNHEQPSADQPSLDALYEQLRRHESRKEYALAEPILRQILAVPGQYPEQYLYLPAEFYEAWGDAEPWSGEVAIRCYTEALNYRYRIGNMATGSGEGMEAMYHAGRVRQKLERLTGK